MFHPPRLTPNVVVTNVYRTRDGEQMVNVLYQSSVFSTETMVFNVHWPIYHDEKDLMCTFEEVGQLLGGN